MSNGAYWNNVVGSLKLTLPVQTLLVQGSSESECREIFEREMKARFAPKLNKLQQELYGNRGFTNDTLKGIVANNRGTGKTTAHAMKQIAEAIENPGKEIELHRDDLDRRYGWATGEYITNTVKPMIEKLGLKFMTIDNVRQTIKFEV